MAELIPMFQSLIGPDHPTTLAAINQQATAILLAGDPNQAIDLLGDLHDRCSARLGPRHPRTLLVAVNRAVAYRDAMRLIEAIPLLEETISLLRDTLGESHVHTLVATNHLIVAYRKAQWFPQAIELLRLILEQTELSLGTDAAKTQEARFELAMSLSEIGDFQEAADLLSARDDSLSKLDAHSDERVEGLVWQGIVRRKLNQLEASDDRLREACDLCAAKERPAWLDAWARTSRADTLLALKHIDHASQLLNESKLRLQDLDDPLPDRVKNLPEQIDQLMEAIVAATNPNPTDASKPERSDTDE
ncbi:MAG: tetratricopeptide repeat protein [Pirellulaceae bacterium]